MLTRETAGWLHKPDPAASQLVFLCTTFDASFSSATYIPYIPTHILIIIIIHTARLHCSLSPCLLFVGVLSCLETHIHGHILGFLGSELACLHARSPALLCTCVVAYSAGAGAYFEGFEIFLLGIHSTDRYLGKREVLFLLRLLLLPLLLLSRSLVAS
ncbi:uncharacterized protein J3D65DRAFT_141701 [Phyllosticta citribraziliensis]|uniref:Uncharacterized protein n=1 Tax=Phyllosticta citribraziliensis TaxID=989973 RepID=A0ABR1L6P4_9PEZI